MALPTPNDHLPHQRKYFFGNKDALKMHMRLFYAWSPFPLGLIVHFLTAKKDEMRERKTWVECSG
jgi:hypothetical protein